MPKLFVLLGAGASHGYGPSTLWLTERLLDRKSGPPGNRLFQRVRNRLQRAFTDWNRDPWDHDSDPEIYKPNFEEIIQAVDEIATHLKHSDYNDRYSPYLSPFVRLNGSLKGFTHRRELLAGYASMARKFISLETKRHCDRGRDPLECGLTRAIETLSRTALLRIMSLNYDDLPAATSVPFYTGFTPCDGKTERFRPSYPWPVDRHLWCQLHGSILFRQDTRWPHEVIRFSTRGAASRRRWVVRAARRFQDRREAVFAPIITGLRKADAIQDEPFSNYSHVYWDEAFSCDRWLIVGYGGNDPHINTVLSQARESWRNRGARHRVVIVSHYEFEDSRPINVQGLIEEPEISEIGNRLWLLEPDADRMDIGMHASIHRKSVSRLSDTYAVTLDGVDWASTEGLGQLTSFLEL